MNRRDFINAGVVATLMTSVLSSRAFSQESSTPGAIPRPQFSGMDAYSRYLHWLREPGEIAEACRELTLGSLMLTVSDGDAHVQLADVTTELPRFVGALRDEGIEVRQIRGGGQTEVDADVERLVGTMSDLGITHYWLGTDRYDFSQPIMPQLDAIKRKVEQFVTLNERYGTTIQYHTRSGASSVGSVVWDLLYVFNEFDPKYVGLHWDTGHMSNHGAMWETLFRAAAPYVSAISWKDRKPVQDDGGLTVEGGFYPGPEGPFSESDVINEQRPLSQTARGNENLVDRLPLPLAGSHFARGMGWGYQDVALGTGWVDFFRYGEVLGEIGYTGLMDLQAEYGYPLGGANRGRTELELPRRMVLGAIKRDALTVRAALAQSGSGISV